MAGRVRPGVTELAPTLCICEYEEYECLGTSTSEGDVDGEWMVALMVVMMLMMLMVALMVVAVTMMVGGGWWR